MADTMGNKITRMSNCNCGITCGCENCNPELFRTKIYKKIKCKNCDCEITEDDMRLFREKANLINL